MLYLLDANVLIDANRDYYPIERVPEFWDWLKEMGDLGRVKIPEEIFEEIVLPPPKYRDVLVEWLQANKSAMVLDEQVNEDLLVQVIDDGYADDLSDVDIEKVGMDPFLIAYAVAYPSERLVITTEHSKPSRTRANRHVPDVCNDLRVGCEDTFYMIRRLNFRTGWNT